MFPLVLALLFSSALGQNCRQTETISSGKVALCQDEVIFQENFNNLDLSRWKRRVTISGEDYDFVVYSSDPAVSYVDRGNLVIKPVLFNDTFVKSGFLDLQDCTGALGSQECQQQAKFFSILPPVKSAQLCTERSFSFKYGVITIRAKLPTGDWIAPQLWLKPVKDKYGAGYASGKVRVASVRGNPSLTSLEGRELGNRLLESGILLASGQENKPVRARTSIATARRPWTAAFHNYTISWGPKKMTSYIDGKIEREGIIYDQFVDDVPSLLQFLPSDNPAWASGSKYAPFDEQFYICLGVTVGGGYGFPDNSTSRGKKKPWKNLTIKMMLDFWQARNDWVPSWSDESKLEVDFVEVRAV